MTYADGTSVPIRERVRPPHSEAGAREVWEWEEQCKADSVKAYRAAGLNDSGDASFPDPMGGVFWYDPFDDGDITTKMQMLRDDLSRLGRGDDVGAVLEEFRADVRHWRSHSALQGFAA